jgi:hypothetical protein
MEKTKSVALTSFQLSISLLTELRMMCLLTNKSQGEFIRISIRDKIKELKTNKKIE